MFFKEYPETQKWYKQQEKAIYWPNGSITEFSYLQNTDDVYTYQGREYDDISGDEVQQHEFEVIKVLRSSLRTINPLIKPRMFLTGNPGGKGHTELKRIFVDRAFTEDERPTDYAFIQSFVKDNLALLAADPEYVQRLKDLPEALRKAYLYGDWNIFTGQVFSEFKKHLHVVRPFIPNKNFQHFLSMDWGYSEKSAFAAFLHCVVEMKSQDGQPFKRVITYKEWHGNQKTPHEWAEIIYKDCIFLGITPQKAYADPAMFNTQTDGSKSIRSLMEQKWRDLHGDTWVTISPGGKNRIARVATVHNWLSLGPDGLPYWVITETCRSLISTLPMLIYDENKVDDVDTSGNDHDYDSVGYLLSEIKFIAAKAGATTYGKADPMRIRYNVEGQELGIVPSEFSKMYPSRPQWDGRM
jgi:phage terminase large subunit